MTPTHYAVIAFSGDPASEHPDPELRGQPPSLDFLAAGPEDWCWWELARWTQDHPLRMWEEAEVLRRDPAVIAQEKRNRDLAAKPDAPEAGVS